MSRHDRALTPDEQAGLEVAGQLVGAGIPVFAAAPALDADGNWQPDGGHGKCGYWLPPKWEITVPTLNWLDPSAPGFEEKAWRPGWALCAVMGHGLDGLDVDPRSGGDVSRAELIASGDWPCTYGSASTPSGGTHELVHSLDVGSKDGLRPGLDVKAGRADKSGRGFLFIAPTAKLSKTTGEMGTYRWDSAPDLDALRDAGQADDSGERLAQLVRIARGEATDATRPADPGAAYLGMDPAMRSRVDAWTTAAVRHVQRELRESHDWPPGHVDDKQRGWERLCADAAYRLSRLARADWNGLAEDAAHQAYAEAAPTDPSWTAKDVESKWKSQHGRGEPAPWPGKLDEPRADFADLWQPAAAVPAASTAESGIEPPTDDPQRLRPLDWHELWSTARSEPEWICEPLLEAGRVVALYSPAKTGKSLLTLEIVAAVSAGRPVLGNPARPPKTVLYVDHENTPDDLRERLEDMGYGPDDLGYLRYLSFPMLPPLDTAQGGAELLRVARLHDVRMVVLDTVSRVIGGEEDSADTFRALYRHTVMPLKAAGIAVWRLDHSGKDAARGQRGSSGKADDVDAVWSLMHAAGGKLILKRTHSRTNHGRDRVEIRRLTDPLRHEVVDAATAEGWLWEGSAVDEIVRRLDTLGVPRDAGRPACRKALDTAGLTASNDDLAAAVRQRRALSVESRTVGDEPAPKAADEAVQGDCPETVRHAHGQLTDSSDSASTGNHAGLSVPTPHQGWGQQAGSPTQDSAETDLGPPAECLVCSAPLLLRRAGRQVCERCRLATAAPAAKASGQ